MGEELSLVFAIFSPFDWGFHSTFVEKSTATKIRIGCIVHANTYEVVGHQNAGGAGSLLQALRLLFEPTLRDGGGVLKDFIDAAGLGFRSAIVKNAKQVIAAL